MVDQDHGPSREVMEPWVGTIHFNLKTSTSAVTRVEPVQALIDETTGSLNLQKR